MAGLMDGKKKVSPQTLLSQGGSVPEQYDTADRTPPLVETLDQNEYWASDYAPFMARKISKKRRYAR